LIIPAQPHGPAFSPQPITVAAPWQEGTDTPVSTGGLSSWALLNLLLAIAGGIAVVLLIIKSRRNRQDNGAQQETARKTQQTRDEENVEPENRRRLIWKMGGLLGGIIGVMVFIVTEDMRNTMRMTDRWTWLMLLIEVVVALCVWMTYRRPGDKKELDQVDSSK
jgi:hypothetical protein